MKKRLKYLKFLLCPLILITLIFISNHSPQGFHLNKIMRSLPDKEEFETTSLTQQQKLLLDRILEQKFYFLANGTQSYAFISHDQKFVLKFFKKKHLIAKNWLSYFFSPLLKNYGLEKVERCKQRLEETFRGYKMAFQDLKKETGLLFIHLNQSYNLKKEIHLIDQKGKKFRIDLDQFEFVIQRRGELVYDRIFRLMREGKQEEAKEAISSLFELIMHRCKKGYADKDLGVRSNYGFIGKRAFQIDVGAIIKDARIQEPSNYEREMRRIAKKLGEWLIENAPELVLSAQEELSLLLK